MNSPNGDRFDRSDGVNFPRFSRQIGILGQLTRSSAATGRPRIGLLRPFSGVLQPETTTNGRPLPDLSYLTLRPVADRIVERERSVRLEERQSNPGSARDAVDDTGASAGPNAVAGASREPNSTADAGSPTNAEPTVREALRESDESDSPDTGPTSRGDQRGDLDIRTLEPDSPSQSRHAMSSRRGNDNRTLSADSADFTATADRSRSAAPDQSTDASDVSTRSIQSSRSTLWGDDPAVGRQSGPPLNVESADVRGASRTGNTSGSDRADTPAPTRGAPPEDARESRTVRESERGERTRSSRSSSGRGTYPTLRLRESDGSTDRMKGTTDTSGGTDTRSRGPSEGQETAGHPHASRDRSPVSFPSDLSLDEKDASRFVDALYRELERKAWIERDRRGL